MRVCNCDVCYACLCNVCIHGSVLVCFMCKVSCYLIFKRIVYGSCMFCVSVQLIYEHVPVLDICMSVGMPLCRCVYTRVNKRVNMSACLY